MIVPSVPSPEWEKCFQDVFLCDLIKEQKAREFVLEKWLDTEK